MDDVHNRLINSFTYHPPKPDQIKRYEQIRDKFLSLSVYIADNTPHSREQSLAFTHLEVASMWANKSIACNEE